MSSQHTVSTSATSSTNSNFILPNDSYIIWILLALLVLAIAGTLIIEASIPHMRTNFVNNVGAVFLSIFAIAIVWYYSGKQTKIFGRSVSSGIVAYVLIIMLLVVIFSG